MNDIMIITSSEDWRFAWDLVNISPGKTKRSSTITVYHRWDISSKRLPRRIYSSVVPYPGLTKPSIPPPESRPDLPPLPANSNFTPMCSKSWDTIPCLSYEEPPESPIRTPDVVQEYPLILNTGGRFMPQFQSEHRQLGMGLREQHPNPWLRFIRIPLGNWVLADGDWAYIETLRGVIKQKVKITDRHSSSSGKL